MGGCSIGRDGELLEVSASCKQVPVAQTLVQLATERSEEVQYLSISANKKALLRQCFFIGEKGRIWTRAPARGSEPSAA
jgi:hypothetical protein